MALLLQYTLIYASVLLLVALGGMLSERAGVINLGLEGTMVVGALGGALTLRALPAGSPFAFILSFAAAALLGVVFSLLLAVSSVTFGADQTLVGTAMNMLATALCTVSVKAINSSSTNGGTTSSVVSFVENRDGLFFRIGKTEISLYIIVAAICMLAAWFVCQKTRFGLRLIACGEHPDAAASVGIRVKAMRYVGVMLSGMLGGLGGLAYITASVNEWKFEVGVAGFGFLALAVMIFGQWKPLPIAVSAVLFGVLRALSNIYTGFDFLEKLGLPSTVYNLLPYVICLVVLAFFSGHSHAPKSAGIPYGVSKE